MSNVSEAAGASSRGGWLPFRVAIVIVVVGLLVVTCGALITYVLYRGEYSVALLKRAYLEQVADTTVREVLRLPTTAVQVLRVQRYRLETGYYSTTDEVALARALAGALQADPDISWVSYSEEATGRFMGAHRMQGDEVILNLSDPSQNGGVPHELRADTLTPYVRTPPLTEPYEPRTRAWYQRTEAAPPYTIVWMPPYTFAEGVQGITAAVAARDASQQVLGVFTVDFALTGVANFLQTIDIGRRSAVVLFDHRGAPLAGAPSPGRDAATRAVEPWTHTGAVANAGVRRAAVTVQGEAWDVVARPITHETGFAWTVAVAVPDEAFMGPVYANRRAAIAIALAGLGLAVVAGVLVSTSLARSLGGATQTLDRIARFELESPARPRSVLREVTQLEDAVGRVTASLRSFSRYAPEEIVREVVASGREAMLSGTRREVSVLFSDLRGFTGFAEHLRPEEVVAILNDHFGLLVGLIARHGGFVVDFLGDAVFTVFGAPRPDADHVHHAVRCALEMQRARVAQNEQHRARGWPPMEMGVGIDTGAAVVGNMGSPRRIKYGVVGNIVNVAARIETFTVGGQVLVSDAIRQALGDQLVVDGPFEAEGKGVGAVIRLWEVLALQSNTPLTLPSQVRDLAVLHPPLEARVRLFLGKQIDRQTYAARLHRLGAEGGEIESDAPLAVFDALQVLLPTAPGGDAAEILDGKVIALSAHEGAQTALVRFTGIDWDTQARLEAFAHRDWGTTVPDPTRT
jgi:adenylate cyclase